MNARAHHSFHPSVPARSLGLRALFVILSLHVCSGVHLWSQVIIVPNASAESDGNAFGTTPGGDDPGARNLNIYDSSQFKALSGPAYLMGFALRPDAIAGPSGPKTGDLKIYVSTSDRPISEITATMNDNVGADATLVFDGPFDSSTASLAGPGNTRQFDIVYPFTTPFLYDPAKGNLVLDFQVTEGHGEALRFDAVTGSPVVKNVFTIGSSTAQNGQFGVAFVAQFTFEPIPLVSIRPSQVEICWSSVPNATYRVEYRSELSDSDWTPVVACVRSTDSTTCIQDPVVQGAPRRFYRVIQTDCNP